MKRFVILLLGIILPLSIDAQNKNIFYEYDDAGNRISRSTAPTAIAEPEFETFADLNSNSFEAQTILGENFPDSFLSITGSPGLQGGRNCLKSMTAVRTL